MSSYQPVRLDRCSCFLLLLLAYHSLVACGGGRPVCHEQGVQTDACELLMEVTFADCVKKMVRGVPEMKLENSAELHRKGRDTKRYADQLANDPKFKVNIALRDAVNNAAADQNPSMKTSFIATWKSILQHVPCWC